MSIIPVSTFIELSYIMQKRPKIQEAFLINF